ncbi:MAG: NAD(P)H-dependent oxidoreductase [Variibacter sp.]
MAKIMIVVGHPQEDTFCEALGEAYQDGAKASGHETKLFHLAAMAFDPILRGGYRLEQALEPDLQEAYRWLAACDHLVLIFPLWCGDMPALLKGFIERVLQPDLIARHGTEHAMNRAIFHNKTGRIVMTMGMPVSIYRFWYGAHALKLLTRNVLRFIGIKPVRHTLFGMVPTSKAEKRTQWLKDVRSLGCAAS